MPCDLFPGISLIGHKNIGRSHLSVMPSISSLFPHSRSLATGRWPLGSLWLSGPGRAIRKPAIDAMLSHAGESIGAGWVFGLNQALDQAGATIGPLVIAAILFSKAAYRIAFGWFLFPALLCLATLGLARLFYPRPHELEEQPSRIVAT